MAETIYTLCQQFLHAPLMVVPVKKVLNRFQNIVIDYFLVCFGVKFFLSSSLTHNG